MLKITRKACIAVLLLAAVFATAAPVQARAISKRSHWFVAPVSMGPRAVGVVEPCSADSQGELNGVTFEDRVVRAPRGADRLIVRLYPTEDWDLYICRNEKVLRYSARGLGLDEVVVVSVRPGSRYRIRALNWLGQPQVRGTYAFYNL